MGDLKIKVSIIILTKDKVDYLKKCIDSLEQYNDMNGCEVIVISNNSVEEDTFKYFELLKEKPNYQLIEHNIPFNYSALNNFGATFASGRYLLFLNNDMEFIESNTISNLIRVLEQDHVGVVGATLLYPDRTIQHVGVNIHSPGAWQPYRYGVLEELPHLKTDHQVTAVIGACLLIRTKDFKTVQGFNENLRVVLNDIDLCMKMNERGFQTICAKDLIIHHEGISRGKKSPPEDIELFCSIWQDVLNEGDQYDISLEIAIQQIEQNFAQHTIELNRPIYVFGTGEKGKTALRILKNYNLQGFIDNDSKKWGTIIEEYPISSPSILTELDDKPYVVIASYYYNEIREQIEVLGFEDKMDFYRLY